MIPVNITIKKGRAWTESFTLRDTSTGNLLPVTGYTGTMTIWDQSGNVLVTCSLVIIADPGFVSYSLTAAQTATLPYTFLSYEISYTPSGGQPATFQEGVVYMELDKPSA